MLNTHVDALAEDAAADLQGTETKERLTSLPALLQTGRFTTGKGAVHMQHCQHGKARVYSACSS